MPFANLLSAADMAILRKPIDSLEEAKAYIEMLGRNNIIYHFDDDPTDIIWNLPKGQGPTKAETRLLAQRTNECYLSFNLKDLDWTNDGGCPIGYCLKVLETTQL